MSVVPVCCPLRLHSVSPCRTTKTTCVWLSTTPVEVGRRVGGPPRLIVGAPAPVEDLRHVLTVLADALPVLDQLVADGLLGIRGACPQPRHPIDHVPDQMKA